MTRRLSDDLLQSVMDDLAQHGGNVTHTATYRGVSRELLRYQIEIAKKEGFAAASDSPPNAVPLERDAPATGRVPLSENPEQFKEDWTADDCIECLRRFAEAHPDQIISRNFFRVTSGISESTWNRYFGTFQEFKAQANITLSRHAKRLEKSIAKHASVDKMRAFNAEKRQWEGTYLRPSSRRWQSVVVFNDVHDKECDPFYRRVLIDTIARVQPEKVVSNGDALDLPEFSKHTQDPRSFKLVERIKWLHDFLGDIRAAAPDAELTIVEGNHEYRLLRHLAEETPAMMVVLADLHGFTIPKLLGLQDFGANYIARADMTAFTERDIKAQLEKNYVELWNHSLLFGHFPHMRNMGIPGASGHHHKHIVWPFYSPVTGPSEWHQVGCGHLRQASYCAGEYWGNGFLIVHTDTHTKRSQFEYVDLSHDGAFVGGKFYERAPDEAVG